MQINQAYPKTIEDHNQGVPRHNDSNKFKCGYCNFQTACFDNFKVHTRKHTGKMFHCQHCDYTTVYSGHLKDHSRYHTGEMLQCQHCDYTTVRSGDLKVHSRNHTDEMLQCQHCDYTTQSGQLKAHIYWAQIYWVLVPNLGKIYLFC